MRTITSTLAVVALLLAAASAPAEAAKPQTRYSLVHGCYALKGADGKVLAGAGQVRMQATTLGRYLLYLPDSTYLTAQPDGSVSPASEPSPAADWTVKRAGGVLFTLTPQSDGTHVLKVRFEPAKGCAVYPEAALDAKGRPAKGNTSF